uniref:Uncharacterized protein n=1 Tax=Arundo donax TaxID=35708 RepID=A0A0A8ZSB9_ARUDO
MVNKSSMSSLLHYPIPSINKSPFYH